MAFNPAFSHFKELADHFGLRNEVDPIVESKKVKDASEKLKQVFTHFIHNANGRNNPNDWYAIQNFLQTTAQYDSNIEDQMQEIAGIQNLELRKKRLQEVLLNEEFIQLCAQEFIKVQNKLNQPEQDLLSQTLDKLMPGYQESINRVAEQLAYNPETKFFADLFDFLYYMVESFAESMSKQLGNNNPFLSQAPEEGGEKPKERIIFRPR